MCYLKRTLIPTAILLTILTPAEGGYPKVSREQLTFFLFTQNPARFIVPLSSVFEEREKRRKRKKKRKFTVRNVCTSPQSSLRYFYNFP